LYDRAAIAFFKRDAVLNVRLGGGGAGGGPANAHLARNPGRGQPRPSTNTARRPRMQTTNAAKSSPPPLPHQSQPPPRQFPLSDYEAELQELLALDDRAAAVALIKE
jgi:hypothetical protein